MGAWSLAIAMALVHGLGIVFPLWLLYAAVRRLRLRKGSIPPSHARLRVDTGT